MSLQAVLLLQPVTYKVYFLDGTFCMVELQPYESVADVIGLVKENLGLASNWGWALYEVRVSAFHTDFTSHQTNFCCGNKSIDTSAKGIVFIKLLCMHMLKCEYYTAKNSCLT